MLVNTICNSNDDTDSETEVKKIQTSHKSQNNNEKTECGPGCTNDSNTTLDTRAENSNNTLQHPKEIALLQDAFTDALSYMNQSQTGLLQQLGNSFCKAIETSLHPVIDNLKQQLLAVQQLSENISKKDRKCDTPAGVKNLQDKVKHLQSVNSSLQKEKFETAVEISKLKSQLKTVKFQKESTHTKQETTIKSLTDDNENLREKICQQKSEYEKLMIDFKLLKDKCDTQFEENLSLKSQISNNFDCLNQREEPTANISATYHKTNAEYKENHLEPRKPTALLLGTSNINGIRPEKLSQYVDVTKVTAYTLDETRSKIETTETRPDVVLLHAFTNDIKTHTPEECIEKLEVITNIISSKWSNTKTIVSLTTPRMDEEIHRVNSEILDGLIKRKYLTSARNEVMISENTNLWQSDNHILKPDRYHLSDQGTSMLAANLKNKLHSSLGIKLPQRNPTRPKIQPQRRKVSQNYNFYGRNSYMGNGGNRGGRGYYQSY